MTGVIDVSFRDDATLLAGLRAGDRDAQLALYDAYGRHVRRVVGRILGPDPQLADVLQDVFLNALKNAGSVRDPERLKGWLTAVAVNTARGRIRRRTRRRWLRFLPSHEVPEVADPGADPEAREALRQLYVLLDKMSSELRIPFTLRFIDDMPLTEVAEACSVSLATIKRRLTRAEHRFVALARGNEALAPWVARHPRWRSL